MSETNTLFKKISLGLVLGIAVLAVVSLVPATDSFVDDTKTYLLFFGALLVTALFIIKTLKEKAMRITLSPVTGALIFFGLAAAASTFFTADYPVEGLVGLGGVFIAGVLIAVLGGSILPKNNVKAFLYTMTGASLFLVISTLMQMVGFGPAQMINSAMSANLPTNALFNLAGSPFIALQVVLLTLAGIVASVRSTKKVNKFFAVALPILVIGAGIYAWNLLPGKPAELQLPSYATSWSVMLDTVRSPRAALIGAGTSSYTNVYRIFKPAWMNNTEQWAAVFSQASNTPLTILTTMGAIGLTIWGFFVYKFVGFHKKAMVESKPLTYMIGAGIVLQLIMPFNTVLLIIQAVALACLVANEKNRMPLMQLQALKFKLLNKAASLDSHNKAIHWPLYLGSTLGFLIIALGFYLVGRSYYANVLMSQSTRALANNDIVGAYELQQQAVAQNPYLDVHRRRYGSTSAVVAIALSNKADITEAERQQVSGLLQQSVREARAATTLDGTDSTNWANLAQVYRNMIGISDDAVDWTVQSYVTAIETNPNDPVLRLELATIFAGQEDYQQAVSIYSQAINIKPDLAVTHFNLGQILEQAEAYREARTSYQRALVLLEASTEDYTVVNQKIEEIEAFMEENNIPLVAPTEEEAAAAQQQAPSITEQNLNESTPVESSNENDVNLNAPETVMEKIDEATETPLSDELEQ